MNKIEKSGVGVGRILLSLLLAFTRGLFGGASSGPGGRGSGGLPGLSEMLFCPGGASQQAGLAASLPEEPRVGTHFKCRCSFCLLASLTLRFTPIVPVSGGCRVERRACLFCQRRCSPFWSREPAYCLGRCTSPTFGYHLPPCIAFRENFKHFPVSRLKGKHRKQTKVVDTEVIVSSPFQTSAPPHPGIVTLQKHTHSPLPSSPSTFSLDGKRQVIVGADLNFISMHERPMGPIFN